MSNRSTDHATFTIERTFDAEPARVFAAWADPQAKAQWFAPPGEASKEAHSLEFAVERIDCWIPSEDLAIVSATRDWCRSWRRSLKAVTSAMPKLPPQLRARLVMEEARLF